AHEGRLVDRPDVAAGDHAVAADEERLGYPEHAVRERDSPVIVAHRRPHDAVVAHVPQTAVARVLIEDADEHDIARAIALVHAHERGVLLLTWQAPRGEEVDDHDLALRVAATPCARAVQLLERERRRWPSDRARLDVRRRAPEGQDQDHHQRGERDHDGGAKNAAHGSTPSGRDASLQRGPRERAAGARGTNCELAAAACRERGMRRGPTAGGRAATTAPTPTIAPPSQIQETNGMTSTRIVAHENDSVSYAARIV